MLISVCKIFEFDAAHHLPGYNGKCANMHGHRWKVEVEVIGKDGIPDAKTGMIMDFHEIEARVQPFIDMLDHSVINDTIPMPTAENIADWLATGIEELNPCRVRVWETATSYAEWLP